MDAEITKVYNASYSTFKKNQESSQINDIRSKDEIEVLNSILSDKYELIRLISVGGMGEVYLATHKILQKKLAIKIISQQFEHKKEVRQQFLKEAKLASGLDHPGIIQILDFGSYDKFDYLVMPYIDGYSLDKKMQDFGHDLKDALKIMPQMISSLIHVHTKNIVHKDIKPSNYMIDRKGKVILIDFGISQKFHKINLTESSIGVGTRTYMSPEQIRGEQIDLRSDLYSLGLIFYELLTGRYLFEYENIETLIYKQMHEIPIHPSEVKKNIPNRLGDIIMRLIQKEPNDRYQDGLELLNDIKEFATINDEQIELENITCISKILPGEPYSVASNERNQELKDSPNRFLGMGKDPTTQWRISKNKDKKRNFLKAYSIPIINSILLLCIIIFLGVSKFNVDKQIIDPFGKIGRHYQNTETSIFYSIIPNALRLRSEGC